jgi:hypothetical protein
VTDTAPAASSRRGRNRKPVWQEVEERDARRFRNRAKAANRKRRPIAVVYDIEPPHVRLGMAWFAVAVAGLVLGVYTTALVYGVTAAIAAAQTARAWRRVKRDRPERPVEAVAAAGAIALPIAASLSTPLLGLTLLGVVALCLFNVTGGPLAGIRTLQCAVWPGAAAAAVVVSYRFEPWSAAALVAVVSAYEIGDYIVGSGASNAIEGPVAGAAAVLVVQFGISAIGLPPFELPQGLGFAALAAVLCPLGQLAASLVLPSRRAPASALRRLDSLLLLGPVWAWLAGQAATSALP